MATRTVIVPIRPGSDGDATHRPDSSTYTLVDPPMQYLEKIGQLWMESRNEAHPGVRYVLDRLPTGYALYQKPRTNDPKHIDRWLYGHPTHKYFDSTIRFFPHFKHLMDHGDGTGCLCTVCQTKGGGSIPRMLTNVDPKPKPSFQSEQITQFFPVPKQRGRPKSVGPAVDIGRVDDEGTPDVYRNLIDKLRRVGSLDQEIEETMSLDWRAERKLITKSLAKISEQPAWVPRIAEIVLFVKRLAENEEICRNGQSGEYRIYNDQTKEFTRFPRWEAGVVSQPAAEAVTMKDLVLETRKEFDVNYSGFRIEPLPKPNCDDKALSKQYKYVPLHFTRPFVFWREFLKGVPEDEWHPTIKHAFTAMSSFSLLEKYRFKGIWPSASIWCKGIYIGSELIVVGDVVRLMPQSDNSACTDVLQVSYIKLQLSNLDKANDNDYDDKHPFNSAVHITGKAWTLDHSRSPSGGWLTANKGPDESIPTIMKGYNKWYPRHGPEKLIEVPFSRILGRCFEAAAMYLWLPPAKSVNDKKSLEPNLSEGLEGIRYMRTYSSEQDKRITDRHGKRWYWGDSRTDALDLETLNGYEVGRYDKTRDPNNWRKLIKVMEGVADEKERMALKQSTLEQRPLRGYLVSSNLVRSAFQDINSGTDEVDSTRESSVVPQKRSHTMASSSGSEGVQLIESDEEEDEDSGERDDRGDVMMTDAGQKRV
ncbi:hypothetical protein K432DRAFT_409333 [Lepidopterella palustris CBS 459.81]|uniref:Cryptic loci regulator 2 N-terminal domain-containing protein n=1 Tax=Lepidopterella palustris CBS 459.81 TaxID=1314670 RepID=A0A8E2E0G8_9PEZI|nr:hypothetical protein K432DRAFT_409333 [Lepidopterella palustris CBS 459.81]